MIRLDSLQRGKPDASTLNTLAADAPAGRNIRQIAGDFRENIGMIKDHVFSKITAKNTSVAGTLLITSGLIAGCTSTSTGPGQTSETGTSQSAPVIGPSATPSIDVSSIPVKNLIDNTSRYAGLDEFVDLNDVSPTQITTLGLKRILSIPVLSPEKTEPTITGDVGTIFSGDGNNNLPFIIDTQVPNGPAAAEAVDLARTDNKHVTMIGVLDQVQDPVLSATFVHEGATSNDIFVAFEVIVAGQTYNLLANKQS